jgi:hypothetical protein
MKKEYCSMQADKAVACPATDLPAKY